MTSTVELFCVAAGVTPAAEISAALHAGRNEIVLRVDNRRQLAFGDPHAYTVLAPGTWNGVIGRLEGMQLRPDLAHQGVAVMVQTHNGSGRPQVLPLCLQARSDNLWGSSPPLKTTKITLAPGHNEQMFFIQSTQTSPTGLGSILNYINLPRHLTVKPVPAAPICRIIWWTVPWKAIATSCAR